MLKLGLLEQTDNGASLVVTGTKAASGDNSLIAAPGAGLCIVVEGFALQNESATATTLILKEDVGAEAVSLFRYYAHTQGAGVTWNYPKKLTANKALNLNLSGANSCGYTVWYHIEKE